MQLWHMTAAAGEGRQAYSTSISQGIGQAGNPLCGVLGGFSHTADCWLLTPCSLHAAACGMLFARLLQCRLIDSQQAKCISIKR